jgi:hypothetical protein
MKIFHDEEDGPAEPVRGLPEALPEGEHILWQGRPSGFALAINAFRVRWVLAYFIGVTAFRVANLSANGAGSAAFNEVVISSLVFCAGSLALIFILAFAMSRAAVFTITNERVVMRYGVAIRKYVNAPFKIMKSAKLSMKSARVGDIALQVEGPGNPPYLHLWPFTRPFKFSNPQPTLRGLENPQEVAQILARAVFDRSPENIQLELGASMPAPSSSAAAPGKSVPAI